jgi:DNA-binding transcriptional MerR regulator
MNIAVTEKLYKIGSVAAFSSLSVKTVRYYEEMGLLSPAVERSPAGYRLFGQAVFNRLAFIKRSQALGLSLQEIKDILQVRDRGELPCSEAFSASNGEGTGHFRANCSVRNFERGVARHSQPVARATRARSDYSQDLSEHSAGLSSRQIKNNR